MTKIYVALYVKYPLFLTDLNETLIFSTDFRKILGILNFMKICQLTAELFHTDGRTERHDKANSSFSQFFKAPNFFDTTIQAYPKREYIRFLSPSEV
jgi:hypothetical protein